MTGRRPSIAVLACFLFGLPVLVLGGKASYEPGTWKGANWVPPLTGLKEMARGQALGLVFFYNPTDRSTCRRWEVSVFERAKTELKELEGQVVFMRINTATREGLPESRHVAAKWKRWCGSVKKAKTYVRLLYGTNRSKTLRTPPSPDSLVRTLKRYVKKNESLLRTAERRASAKTQKKTGKEKDEGQADKAAKDKAGD